MQRIHQSIPIHHYITAANIALAMEILKPHRRVDQVQRIHQSAEHLAGCFQSGRRIVASGDLFNLVISLGFDIKKEPASSDANGAIAAPRKFAPCLFGI